MKFDVNNIIDNSDELCCSESDLIAVAMDDDFSYKIRERGNKWKNLKNRHSVELSENILILSR